MDDWSRLLEGPRGRRLAALVAVEVERQHWPATSMDTLGPLEIVYSYSEIERPRANSFPDPGQDETTEEEDLIAALDNLAIEPLDEAALPHDLAEVVNSARYWQEPDRIEGFLAHPEVIRRLRPWVEELSHLESTAWWTSQADLAHQFIARSPRDETWESPVHERLTQWSADERQGEQDARRDRPADPQAPYSGQWWSTPPAQGTTRAWPTGLLLGQPLAASLLEDATFDPDEATWGEVDLPRSPRVLEVVCAQDWVNLCRENPIEVSASRRHDWYRCTGRVGRWVIPDWSQIAQRWDAIHLPVTSYLELAGRALPVGADFASVIAGWSPDTTYWLTVTPELPV